MFYLVLLRLLERLPQTLSLQERLQGTVSAQGERKRLLLIIPV